MGRTNVPRDDPKLTGPHGTVLVERHFRHDASLILAGVDVGEIDLVLAHVDREPVAAAGSVVVEDHVVCVLGGGQLALGARGVGGARLLSLLGQVTAVADPIDLFRPVLQFPWEPTLRAVPVTPAWQD